MTTFCMAIRGRARASYPSPAQPARRGDSIPNASRSLPRANAAVRSMSIGTSTVQGSHRRGSTHHSSDASTRPTWLAEPQRNQAAANGRRRERRPLARGVRALPAHANATWPRTACSPTSAICGGFSTWLGGRRIEGLSISELADYPAWLTAQELAPASISRHVVSLKVFFRYLQLEGVLTDNQAELLGTQKLWQRVPTVLSNAEIDVAAHRAPSRRGRGGGAIGRCWSCCTPPAAACRSCRSCGRATCIWPSATACATARATSSASCRWAARRWRPSKRTCSTSGRSWPSAASRRRSSCCSRRAAAGCGASGFGS